MARRIRTARVQIDHAGITALTGASASTIAGWRRRRATTWFPAKADTDTDGRDWFWSDQIRTFWDSYQARRANRFTAVDRRGHPDDLLTAPEAARVLGYKDHRSLTDLLRDDPDHIERLPSGRLRRYWYRRTVWAYAEGRPLRTSTGHPTGPTGRRKPHRYADDPRLRAAAALLAQAHRTSGHGLGAVLAARLGIGLRTAQRLLAAARASGLGGRGGSS